MRLRIDGEVPRSTTCRSSIAQEAHYRDRHRRLKVGADPGSPTPEAAPRRIVRDGAAPRGRARHRGRDGHGREHLFSAKSPAASAAIRFPSSSHASSPSTTRWAACPRCEAWARSPSSTPSASWPSRTCRSPGRHPRLDRRNSSTSRCCSRLRAHYHFDVGRALRGAADASQNVVLHGSGEEKIAFRYPGEKGRQRGEGARLEGHPAEPGAPPRETDSVAVKESSPKYLNQRVSRLRRHAAAARGAPREVSDRTIHELSPAAGQAQPFFEHLELPGQKKPVRRRSCARSPTACSSSSTWGSTTCSLTRPPTPCPGGEAQRIRLASQIGSGLTASVRARRAPIGLHQRDNERLIGTLKHLRDLGNSVIVVEHDERSDPRGRPRDRHGAGRGRAWRRGGAQGTPAEILKHPRRYRAIYFGSQGDRHPGAPAQARRQALPAHRRRARQQPEVGDRRSPGGPLGGDHRRLGLRQVHAHQRHALPRDRPSPLRLRGGARRARVDRGARLLRQGDQRRPSPIGRTPRSNPATYTGSSRRSGTCSPALPESRARGYGPGASPST